MFATIPDTSNIEDSIVSSAGQMAAAQCRWLLEIADLDAAHEGEVPGYPSTAAWLGWRCSIGTNAAKEYVSVARALSGLPGLTREFSQGRLSWNQVRLIARVATPEIEETLLEIARYGTVGQLQKVVGAYRSALEAQQDAQRRRERRALNTWFDEEGFFILRGRLCPEEGAVVDAALRRAMQQMPAPAPKDQGPADPPGDVQDGYGARQADALAHTARVALAAESAERPSATLPELIVLVDADSLAGRQGEDCHLASGVALAPSTALRLACDAAVVPLLQDLDGNPLSVGRRTRVIPRGIRRALKARDGVCRFPGCERKCFLDGHHVHHWTRGGQTSLDNLVELCGFHHHLVHEGGYLVKPAQVGFKFFCPDGTPVPGQANVQSCFAGDIKAQNLAGGVEVEPDAISSRWDGDRMDLGWVIDALFDSHPDSEHDPP